MRFRKKNLDYEILKAVSERKPELMQAEVNSINVMKLTQQFHERLDDSELRTAYDEMQQRVEALHHDGLIGRGLINGCESNLYIRSIKPEGRMLLDRIENNRWQRRVKDLFFGFIGAVVLAYVSKLIN